MIEVEVFVLVDAAGDYAVGNSPEAAREKYGEDVGPLEDTDGFRLVKVLLNVPLPEVVELAGDVPPQGSASLTVAAA